MTPEHLGSRENNAALTLGPVGDEVGADFCHLGRERRQYPTKNHPRNNRESSKHPVIANEIPEELSFI